MTSLTSSLPNLVTPLPLIMEEHPIMKIKHKDHLINLIYLNPKKFNLNGDPGNIYDQSQKVAKELLTNVKHKDWKIINKLI